MTDSQFNLSYTQVVEYALYPTSLVDDLENDKLELNFTVPNTMGNMKYKLFKNNDVTPLVDINDSNLSPTFANSGNVKFFVKKETNGDKNKISIRFESLVYGDYGTYKIVAQCLEAPYTGEEILSQSFVLKSPEPRISVTLPSLINAGSTQVTLNPLIFDLNYNYEELDKDLVDNTILNPIEYKWYKNNQLIDLATTEELVVTQSNIYQVKIKYNGIVYESNACRVNLYQLDGTVTNKCVQVGTNVNFNVDFFTNKSGSGNLSYKWYRVNSQTSSVLLSNNVTLLLSNVRHTDSGDYKVVVTDNDVTTDYTTGNSASLTKEINFKLEVLDISVTLPSEISLQNNNTSYTLNPQIFNLNSASPPFSALVDVDSVDKTKCTFKWMKNGSLITSAFTEVYNVDPIVNVNGDAYVVEVTYNCTQSSLSPFEGGTYKYYSNPCIVNFYDLKLKDIPHKCKNVGESVTLKAEFLDNIKMGSGNLAYKWRFNNTVVSTDRTFNIDNLKESDEGKYLLEVKDLVTDYTAPLLSVYVYVKNLKVSLVDYIGEMGVPPTLTPVIYNMGTTSITPTYRWFYNNAIVAGVIGSSYTPSANQVYNGVYAVEVTFRYLQVGDVEPCVYVVNSNFCQVRDNACNNLKQTLTYVDESNEGYFNNKTHRIFTVEVTGGSGNYKYTWLRSLNGYNNYVQFPSDEAEYGLPNQLRVPINLLTKYKFKVNVTDLGV